MCVSVTVKFQSIRSATHGPVVCVTVCNCCVEQTLSPVRMLSTVSLAVLGDMRSLCMGSMCIPMQMHVSCLTLDRPLTSLSHNTVTLPPLPGEAYHLPLLTCHLLLDSGRAQPSLMLPLTLPPCLNETGTFWRMSLPNPTTSPCIDGLCLSAGAG